MNKKKGSIIKELVPYVVIPVITLVVNILFSETQNNVGIGITLLGTLIVLCVLVVLSLTANWLIRSVVKDGIESVLLNKTEEVAIEAISRYEEKRKLSEQISEKLFSLNQLLEFEENREINGAKIKIFVHFSLDKHNAIIIRVTPSKTTKNLFTLDVKTSGLSNLLFQRTNEIIYIK